MEHTWTWSGSEWKVCEVKLVSRDGWDLQVLARETYANQNGGVDIVEVPLEQWMKEAVIYER